MLVIEIAGDDLVKNGEFVTLGRVALAIAQASGAENMLDAERKLFARINAGIQQGTLNPLHPENLTPLSKGDYGIGIVPFGELVEWGNATKAFEFRRAIKAADLKLIADLDDRDERDKQRAEIRRKEGRYNLEEAAEMIATGAGEVYEKILGMLERAAESHALPTYMRGSTVPTEFGGERGQWPGVDAYLEECFWDDLNKWLKTEMPRIKYEFPNPEPANVSLEAATEKPPLQQLFQEQEILRVIHELGYEPKKLQKQKPGMRGVKAEVRQNLSFQVRVFDKAWERLRASQDIQDAE